MTDEQLAELSMYKPGEVARMLSISITRLERWAREDRVPHVRTGVLRGVEYTAEDVRRIGQMLPARMGGRRGGQATVSREDPTGAVEQSTSDAAGQQSGGEQGPPSAPAEPPLVDIAAWAQLRAHRPRPRST